MEKDLLTGLSLTAQEQYLVTQGILSGAYGSPGDVFITTRELAEQRKVSLVTAQHIMVGLREQNLIELRGKRYYLAHTKQIEEKNLVDRIIGMIVPNFDNIFYGQLIKAAKSLAWKKGYRVLVMESGYHVDQETTVLALFRHFGVAGVLSCPASPTSLVEVYNNYPLPCVFTSRGVDNVDRATVLVTPILVTKKIVCHLVEEGYRRFVYVGTKMQPLLRDERYIGFRTGLMQQGYTLEERNVVQLNNNPQTSNDAIRAMLQGQTYPVAVFCYHDLFAAEVMRVCHQLGLRIPEDVGIVGFDDLTISKYVYPSLTTVSYRAKSLMEIALQLLWSEIEGSKRNKDTYHIEPTLVIRQSTNLSQRRMGE